MKMIHPWPKDRNLNIFITVDIKKVLGGTLPGLKMCGKRINSMSA